MNGIDHLLIVLALVTRICLKLKLTQPTILPVDKKGWILDKQKGFLSTCYLEFILWVAILFNLVIYICRYDP